MQWRDSGIVVGLKPHGEGSGVLDALTAEHGRHAGLVRGIRGKAVRGVFEPGNLLKLDWRARLSDHLGHYAGELDTARAAAIMPDADRLACLSAACALIRVSLPEREPFPRLFTALDGLTGLLANDAPHEQRWLTAYMLFERVLLEDLGFGLDLSACAATGQTEHLIYISPKTGRAVSESAGAPYRDRLLPLPPVLRMGLNDWAGTGGAGGHRIREIRTALSVTGHFLGQCLFTPQNRPLPPARTRFIDQLGLSTTGY